jgi:hypothetical protein
MIVLMSAAAAHSPTVPADRHGRLHRLFIPYLPGQDGHHTHRIPALGPTVLVTRVRPTK